MTQPTTIEYYTLDQGAQEDRISVILSGLAFGRAKLQDINGVYILSTVEGENYEVIPADMEEMLRRGLLEFHPSATKH